MKLLVADDAVGICTGIRDGIAWAEHGIDQVFLAYDGDEALAVFEAHQPEIVISDIRMAGMDGLALSRELLRRRRETRIILLSAYSEFAYAREALHLGVFAYELKPVKVGELVRRVEEAQQSWLELTSRDQAIAQVEKLRRQRRIEELLRSGGEPGAADAAFGAYGLSSGDKVLCAVLRAAGEDIGPDALAALLSRIGGVYLAQLEHEHIAVFPGSASMLSKEKQIADLQRLVRCELPVRMSCGLSSFDTLERLSGLLAQAREAERLSFYTGEQTVNRWSPNHAFVTQEIPAFSVEFSRPQGSGDVTWADIRQEIDRQFDAIRQHVPRYEPKCVHAFALESIRVLRRNMRRWTGEDDSDVRDRLHELERRGPLPVLEGYREWITALYQGIFTRYFEGERGVNDHFVMRCKFHIQHHYMEDLRVQDMADTFCITANYFSHLFKKAFGIPFKKYLTAVRIEAAEELLREGNMQATEVARAVGFVDYKYFHQVYRRHTNSAPTRRDGAGRTQVTDNEAKQEEQT